MARTFSGTSQYLSKSSDISGGYPCSFAAWINVANITGSKGIFGINLLTGANGPCLYTAGATIIADIGGVGAATTVATISAGTWFHVGGVFASLTSRSVYLSGGNKVSNATSLSWGSPTASLIGDVYQSGHFPMNGAMAWAGIWKAILSDADLVCLAAGAHPTLVQRGTLIACLDMTGGNSPEPDMFSATGWTLTGAPTSSANPRIYGP